MAIKYPDRIESNNPQAYGIVKATEIAGQRLVKQLSDLYKLPDAILSESKTGEDAEGLIWIVGKDLYQLISWQNRNDASGWLKVIPFNEKMFDRFYNLDGNMINSLTGYIKATELLNLLENDSLLNALGKLEYKADLTYDLVTSVYEGVHTIEELREMLKILEEIQNSSEVLNSYLSKYLPLAGGIMSGSIDMNKNSLKNAGFEVVTALPTTNLFNGRQVTYEGKLYTYNNEWICIADDLGGKPETHEENFVYQPTAADLSIKDGFADIKKLKGNTVVWNQKFINKAFTNNGVSITTSEDVLILNGTLNNTYLGITSGISGVVKIPLNHIGYYKIVILKDNNNILQNRFFALFNRNKSATITQNTAKFLYQNTNDSLGWGFGISTFSGGEVFEDVQIKANVFDLTQMFGEGNEPTIEEFEAMFPNDYYEYNEGELMSFDGKGLKSVGFNQWDEEWESGKLNTTTGNNVEDTTRIRSKNYIKVFPSTKYYFTSPTGTNSSSVWIALYDKNYNIIQGYNGSGLQTSGNMFNIVLAPDRNREFTTSPNAAYIRFYISTEFNHDICLNLVHSGYRNGEYEKYEDYTLSFQDGKAISQLTGKLNGEGDSVVIFPDGLRSAGEAFDEIVYDEATGKHKAVKRIGSVDMGALNWSNNNMGIGSNIFIISSNQVDNINMARNKSTTSPSNMLSVDYYPSPTYALKGLNNAIAGPFSKSILNGALMLGSTSYTDVASLKASLQGQILYYELETPEVYELDFPINTSYKAYDFGTEEVLYSDGKEVNIPMKANIEYGFNAVDMIRGNYFDIQKLKKKTITTEIDVPILVHGHDDIITYNPNFTLNKFNEYLPLAGGSMSGNIDMRGNEIKNTNFELVEFLPTENLYEGRQVTYDGKIYTYHNEKWISTADDLGDLKETLSSEFVFRPTADTHSVKDEFASVKSVKGNTVVWNQLDKTENGSVKYKGLTCSWNNGILTINGEVTEDGIFYGVSHGYRFIKSEHNVYHKINISGDFVGSKKSFVTHSLGGNSSNFKLFLDSKLKQIKGINKADNYTYFAFEFYAGDIFTNVKIQSQLIDLTQMFGEGNEPTSVEEFEKLYSHLPADYNEGSLLNINADSIKSTGFNLFDKTKVLFNKYIDKQGLVVNGDIGLSDNVINGVSDWIKVFPNTNYFVKDIISNAAMRYAAYDAEKNYITSLSNNTTHTDENIKLCSKKITTPNNTHYIRFGVSDKHIDSACINLSHNGERDGEYQSYEEHIVNLPIKKYFPDGLKSAGAVYDEIVFDKNIGKYKAIQRIGSVDMGTLNWTYNDGSSNPTSYPYGFFQNSLIVRKPGRKTIKCVKYLENVNFQVDKRIVPALYQSTVYIIDSSYTDVDSLKTSLQGQILYYELAEPIETIIEDYDLIAYKANDWGTEEIISEEPTTPIKADIEYNFDATNEIRNHIFEIKKLNKKIDELTALVESLLTTLNVNYEKVEN